MSSYSKKQWKLILVILLGITFVFTVGGGYVYYSMKYAESGFAGYILAFQNGLKTLCFSPMVTLEDLLEFNVFTLEMSGKEKFWIHAFCVAVILMPILNVWFIWSILDKLLHFFVGFPSWKKQVLIVGYNEKVKQILRSKSQKYKVYLWTEEELSAEEERDLYLRGIVVKAKGYGLGDTKEEFDKQVKKFNRFLKNVSYILLLHESDVLNMQYYMALSKCPICETEEKRFWVSNKEFSNKNALQDYFDKELKNNKLIDLRIFNYAQIKAEHFFKEFVSNYDNKENQKVHGLIVGGGQAGESILLHAINQSVLSPENEILIDVIDVNVENLKKRLKERFNSNYVTEIPKQNEFRIEGDKADGLLRIRLTQVNIYDDEFGEKVKQLQQKSNGGEYSFIAICIPDMDANMRCALEIKKAGLIQESKIPLALRMTYSFHMEEYMKTLGVFSKVYMMGEREENLSLDQVINQEEEREIRIYHSNYNKVKSDKMGSNQKEEWNELKYYKRQSNRALYYHKKVKAESFKECAEEMGTFWAKRKECQTGNGALEMSQYLIEGNGARKSFPMLEHIAKTEHRRFCYFYASEGWGHIKGKKNETDRLHNCLCNWEDLKKHQEETKEGVLVYDLLSAPSLMKE